MTFRIFLLAVTLSLSFTVSAQRDLEFVEDIGDHHFSGLAYEDKVLIFGGGEDYLRVFSDAGGLRRYSYPTVDGARLRLYGGLSPTIYNSNVYLVLYNSTNNYLYRFNGTTFSLVATSGTIVSRLVAFREHLYFLSRIGSTIQLYRYNGFLVSAVTSGTIPETRSYDLIAAGSYLYLIGQGYYADEPYTVKRFNGTTVFTLPPFTFFNGITNIYAVGSNAYFKIGNYRILYYNGTSVSTIYDLPGSTVNAALWSDNLYFIATVEHAPATVPLRRVNAGVVSEIPMPAGELVMPFTNLALYQDALYFQVTRSEFDNKVLRYDGTAFTNFFTIPGELYSYGVTFTRQDDLIIQPEIINDGLAYEYDGTTGVFTELRAPEGHSFATYYAGTECHHLWYTLHYDDEDEADPYRWALSKEPICPPDTTTTVLVIPEHFIDFERVDLKTWAQDRGWCWNEIIIDWGIEPCEFPDCPDPIYNLRMFDKKNELAFETKIEKPSVLAIPLKDDQPYSARLSAASGNKEDLFVFAGNLVEKGIESISLSMEPGKDFFKLEATTDKNSTVPLKVELLSKSGEILWEKEFSAPFSEQIFDKVKVPGQTLRFSIPGIEQKSIITNLNIYPNPSKGVLNLQVKTDKIFTEAQLSISTLLGQRVMDRKIEIPFSRQIKLNNIKPGMYVLKIVTGQETVSRIIHVE